MHVVISSKWGLDRRLTIYKYLLLLHRTGLRFPSIPVPRASDVLSWPPKKTACTCTYTDSWSYISKVPNGIEMCYSKKASPYPIRSLQRREVSSFMEQSHASRVYASRSQPETTSPRLPIWPCLGTFLIAQLREGVFWAPSKDVQGSPHNNEHQPTCS